MFTLLLLNAVNSLTNDEIVGVDWSFWGIVTTVLLFVMMFEAIALDLSLVVFLFESWL